MGKSIKVVFGFTAVIVIVTFLLVVLAQIGQIVEWAGLVHETFQRVVLVVLLVLYAALIAVPALLILRFPKPLLPPKDGSDTEERIRYLKKVRERYEGNPLLPHNELDGLSDAEYLQAAHKRLDQHADRIMKKSAASLFMTTAVSQNGRLDGLLVLITQCRMVYQIVKVYHQRPGLRELAILYANVAVTTFLAEELEETDVLEQQMEPLIASVLSGSVLGAIPGTGQIANLAVNSIMQGASNAFLTLRVGCIAKRYCTAEERPNKSLVRRSAFVEASGMLGSVVAESAAAVGKLFLGVSKKIAIRGAKLGKEKSLSLFRGIKRKVTGQEGTAEPAGEAAAGKEEKGGLLQSFLKPFLGGRSKAPKTDEPEV